MSHEFDQHFIILPDGSLEKATGKIPADVPLEAIVFPRVSADLVTQARYEQARLDGWAHGMASVVAFKGYYPLAALNRDAVCLFKDAIASLDELQLSSALALGMMQFVRYIMMRMDGQSHNIAMVLATRSFPGVKTDSVFNEGKFSGESNSGCHAKEMWLRKEAEKNGFSTNGLWYCSGLAMHPGDLKAWVGGRGDVERVARERNLTVDGYVNHKGREVAPKPDIAIDPVLVRNETLDVLDSHPGAKYDDVYEQVYNLRSGKVDNNPLVVSEPTQDWG